MPTTHNPPNQILKLTEVGKTFQVGANQLEIIKNISFSINKGEFVILFGPSGCGKSTILNILLGLEPPTKGSVTFLDQNLYDENEDGRAQIRKEKIGMIYQQSNWIKSLNVLDNVCFPLTLKGVARPEREKLAWEKLKLVAMDQGAYQLPTELSSGQQQRVSLARALISEPSLVVADEPTGNLDSKASNEIMELFSQFNKNGNTVIMVTHDLEYLSYATNAIHITDGEIIGRYTKDDIKLKELSVSKRTSFFNAATTQSVKDQKMSSKIENSKPPLSPVITAQSTRVDP